MTKYNWCDKIWQVDFKNFHIIIFHNLSYLSYRENKSDSASLHIKTGSFDLLDTNIVVCNLLLD